MKKRNWKEWALAALFRAIRTVAQTAIATIGSSALISEVNWAVVASSAGLAGILSILMSIQGLPEVEDNTDDHGTRYKEEE